MWISDMLLKRALIVPSGMPYRPYRVKCYRTQHFNPFDGLP